MIHSLSFEDRKIDHKTCAFNRVMTWWEMIKLDTWFWKCMFLLFNIDIMRYQMSQMLNFLLTLQQLPNCLMLMVIPMIVMITVISMFSMLLLIWMSIILLWDPVSRVAITEFIIFMCSHIQLDWCFRGY